MGASDDLFDGWKKILREGVTSYLDTLENLQEGRRYHQQRSGENDDAFNQGFRVEIPLFWGTF